MVTGVADPTDVLVRMGFWRFGATPARLGIDGERLTITSVDSETGETNALIVSARLNRVKASAFGSVILFEIEGNRYRVDFGGFGRSKRMTQWRALLEFAGLRVTDRFLHPVAIVLMVLGVVFALPYFVGMLIVIVAVIAGVPLDGTP